MRPTATLLAAFGIGALGCEEESVAPSKSACEMLAEERAACDAPAQTCAGELAECNAGCLLGLGCHDLLESSNEPGAIACRARCAPKFTCDDGSTIPEPWLCDLKADCPTAEDEEECPSP